MELRGLGGKLGKAGRGSGSRQRFAGDNQQTTGAAGVAICSSGMAADGGCDWSCIPISFGVYM